MKKQYFISCLLITSILINAQEKEFPKLNGPYLGQKSPGTTPEIFIPEILISKNHPHGHLIFSRDSAFIYWSALLDDGLEQTIFYSTFDGKTISYPQKASFATDSGCGGPSFSADEKRIYFNMKFPVNPKGNKKTALCYTEWEEDKWGSPIVIESTVDTLMTKGQVSVVRSGNIYFSGRKNTEKFPTIYICRNDNGKILPPEEISGSILDVGLLIDPWVDLDEKFMLVSCPPESGPPNRTDIGISFRNADGSWGRPIKPTGELNTNDFERWPSLSPDEKYIFFIRSSGQQFTLDNAHFYWVSAKICEALRSKE